MSKDTEASYAKSHKIETLKQSEVKAKLAKIYGNWGQAIYIDDQKVREVMNPAPHKVENLDYVLPSDCNFR